MLKLLWENISDIAFVRDYRRKIKQTEEPKAKTDEEIIEKRFPEVGMKQEDDGYHVVEGKHLIFIRILLELI